MRPRLFALYEPSRTLMDDGSIDENWKPSPVKNALTKPSGTKDVVVVVYQWRTRPDGGAMEEQELSSRPPRRRGLLREEAA